jgi:hypothetical protein
MAAEIKTITKKREISDKIQNRIKMSYLDFKIVTKKLVKLVVNKNREKREKVT